MYDIHSNANNDLWRFTIGKSGIRNLITIGLKSKHRNDRKVRYYNRKS